MSDPNSSSSQKLWDKLFDDLHKLENPTKPPITMYKHSRMQNLKSGLSAVDLQIMERLERLREDRKKNPVPSEDDIRERLSRLRDEPQGASSSLPKKEIFKADTRSDQQKVDDIVKQYTEECQIDQKFNMDTGDDVDALIKKMTLKCKEEMKKDEHISSDDDSLEVSDMSESENDSTEDNL